MCMIAKGTGLYQEGFVASFLSYLLQLLGVKLCFFVLWLELVGRGESILLINCKVLESYF